MGIGVISFLPAGFGGGRGKFVLLGAPDGTVETALFSDYNQDFQHSQIVARWERTRGQALSETGRRVLGGGKWELTDDGRTLRLGGESLAYGGFDRTVLAESLIPGTVFGERRIVYF